MGALARDIMGGGTGAGQAKAMNGRVQSSLSAAGTTISDAYQIAATVNHIGTCASGAGVKCFNGEIADELEIYNGGAAECLVYPHSSTGTINQLSAGSAFVLPQYTMVTLRRVTSVIWIAQLSG